MLQLPGSRLPQTLPTDGSAAGNNDPRQTLKLIMPSLGHKYKVSALQSGKMAQSQQALTSVADSDSEVHKIAEEIKEDECRLIDLACNRPIE